MNNELSKLRKEIDEIDEKIFGLFSYRQKISTQIGKCKKKYDLAIVDQERQNTAIEKRLNIAKELNISEDDAKDLYDFLCKKSVDAQELI